MALNEKLIELNTAMDNLIPNIYFMSLMLGRISVPGKYKISPEVGVEYIEHYYALEQKLRDVGITAKIEDDLDAAEEYWKWRIDFAKEWNEVVGLFKGNSDGYITNFMRKDATLEKIKICSQIFSLPGGHYSEPLYGFPGEDANNPLFLKEKKAAIKSALEYEQQGLESQKAISKCEYEDIVCKLVELKNMILKYGIESDFGEIEEYVSIIRAWLIKNIGYNRHVGNYRMMEYGEEVFDKLEGMFFNDLSDSEIKSLAHDVEHLIFRVAAFYGEKYEEVIEKYDVLIED